MVPVKAVSPVVVVALVMVDPGVSRVVMDPAAPSRWVHQAQVWPVGGAADAHPLRGVVVDVAHALGVVGADAGGRGHGVLGRCRRPGK